MYSEAADSRKTIGDVDVFFHEGIYHLFHLVLPNHDFVAHAVSNDCFNWRRVENAIHLGHPGSFDDSMLWTTHVSPHPYRDGWFRMFYTGLSRRDSGLIQRIGMAESPNLYCWEKAPVHWVDRRSELPYALPGRPEQPPFRYDADSCFPLQPDPQYYESKTNEARHWISFRDPFYFRENGRGFLFIAGRVNHGPVVRRGCVAVFEEVEENHFESRPPLHHPGMYDDVEVPNLIREGGEYYLLGSVREDAKIRYWHTEKLCGFGDSGKPWRSYADNVLLPGGNYAGRVCQDDNGYLLFSFFTPGGQDRTSLNLMPPPKRLRRHPSGQLVVESFEGFDHRVGEDRKITQLCPLKNFADGQCHAVRDNRLELANESGCQIFVLDEDLSSFRLDVSLAMCDEGKCGFVFRLDRETHDGYYLSLDLFKGVAQIRAWGSGPEGSGENMMQFATLQSGYWITKELGKADLTLLAYGSYIELSIGGAILLSLADQTFDHGAAGFYLESAELTATEMRLRQLEDPIQSDDHLTNG